MSSSPWTHDVHGLLKPKFRGLIHLYAIAPMLIAGIVLLMLAPSTGLKFAVGLYVFGVVGMLTSSATYHRAHVTEKTRVWLRRLDHAMIGVTVAGTYTPVVVLVLDGPLRATLLGLLWAGAIGNFVTSLAFPATPRAVRAAVFIALGWGGAVAMPWIWTHGGVPAFVLVVVGALLYSAGAVIYALRKPNPWPAVFGFHEIFHALVLAAAVSHFAAVALVIANAS
jgi:hemolysin III